MDSLVLVRGGPTLTAEFHRLAGECYIEGEGEPLRLERLSPRSLRVTLLAGSVRSGGTWFSYTEGPDGSGADGATLYTVGVQQPVPRPSIELGSSFSGSVLRVALGDISLVDYAEVQHRRPGSSWSPIIRTTRAIEIPLEAGERHEVRARSVSDGRRSGWTTRKTTVIGPPGAVRDVRVRATDQRLTVEFLPPASNGGTKSSTIRVFYAWDEGRGSRICLVNGLTCHFQYPPYPGVVGLWATNFHGGMQRYGPVVVVPVPDPTP